MDAPAVTELHKQAVAAGRRVTHVERELVAERVGVLVREVAGAQHDEVAARAEVGLQGRDQHAAAADGEAQLVAVGARRPW